MPRALPRPRSARGWTLVSSRHGRSFQHHLRNYGESERQREVGPQSAIDKNLHRHALHDLHEVSRRVLSGESRKARTAAKLDTVHVTVEFQVGISIDGYIHRITRTHTLELRLLEVGRDPDGRGHQ